MSWVECNEPLCDKKTAIDAIDTVVIPRARDLGGFEVRRELVVLKPSMEIVVKAKTAARLMLVGGEPMDGPRHLWWNFVSGSKERIEQAKADWLNGKFDPVPEESEFIPLPKNLG